jgi:hypothetical protein
MINISNVRLEWIWTETFRDLVAGATKVKSASGIPDSEIAYTMQFEEARMRKGPMSLPWMKKDEKRKSPHFFWDFYLETDSRQVQWREALRRFVPLRENPFPIKARGQKNEGASLEVFYYPHGFGVVLTVRIERELPLNAMIDRAVEWANTGTFDVRWPQGAVGTFTRSQLAPAVLDRLRKSIFGENGPQGTRSKKAFSVASIIESNGVDLTVAVTEGGEIHRALEGLCTWNQNWKISQLHPLAAKTVRISRSSPVSHLLYGLTSGRAVWFPGSARVTKENDTGAKNPIGCYQRNLVLASLQTEILASLMINTQELLQNGIAISPGMTSLVQGAAGILGRLYGADKGTYMSSSPRMQIDDNGWAPAINYVRNFFGGMDPLH